VLSVTRHRVPPQNSDAFLADAETAVELLRHRPGFVSATVGRATDDAELWLVATSWTDVGSFRRALSSYEVKTGAVPLLASAVDEPTAFEPLVEVDDQGLRRRASDRAADADWSGPA
jgi:quinol monooxygenase YgiN